MGEGKHTQGQWLAAQIDSTTINVVPHSIHRFKAQVVGTGGSTEAGMVAHVFGTTAEQAAANARLIAAAPDLLEALRELSSAADDAVAYEDGSGLSILREASANARAAIAKATA